jgi:hypothetical protein
VKPAAVRLAIAAALFIGWIGYLGYLVVATRGAVVLSRPQILAADVVVVGTVEEDRKSVWVQDVLWPDSMKESLRDQTIAVDDLDKSQTWEGSPPWVGSAWKWKPGEVKERDVFLLPLTGPSRTGDGERLKFHVTAIPLSPGFDGVVREPGTGKPIDADTLKPIADGDDGKHRLHAARIYRADDRTFKQFWSIPR